MNDYYVYIYWRLDTNEPFYVGKGCKNRWKDFRKRGKHFNNIIKKFPFAVVIEKDNLTENEAFYWEEEIIRQLVFEYGFSIEILNNNSKDHYCHLVNQTWGGEGTSGVTPWSKGKNTWEYMTEETKEKAKNKISKANSGEKHPMYGKNPRDYMTEEAKKEHDKKLSESRRGKCIGKDNINAVSVICLTTKRIFYTATEGSKYYKINRNHISSCCKGKRKSCGKYNGEKLIWRYLVWKHNKKYRIKSVK